jgi:hypothetical protein
MTQLQWCDKNDLSQLKFITKILCVDILEILLVQKTKLPRKNKFIKKLKFSETQTFKGLQKITHEF